MAPRPPDPARVAAAVARYQAYQALRQFRARLYECQTARPDAAFELVGAILCADHAVTSLVQVKIGCLAAGMAAGADSIDDMDLLRHGALPAVFDRVRAPSTLGSFLRSFTWGNVRQLEKVSRNLLAGRARRTPLLPGADQLAFTDIDSIQRRVYGHNKQGAAFGHTKISGDPALARDLARSAARNPRTAWCVTVTDGDGHAIGHGCGRPGPARPAAESARGRPPGPPGGHDPPGTTTESGRPGFAFNPATAHGPPGGYGTWRLTTGIPGQRDLIIPLGPITTGQCDHRHEALGHDPGLTLRHPVPGPARHLYRPDLPAARRPVRLRTQHPLRGRRPDLPMQRRPAVHDITTHFVGMAPSQPGCSQLAHGQTLLRTDMTTLDQAWAGGAPQQYRSRRSHRRCTVRGARFARRARM